MNAPDAVRTVNGLIGEAIRQKVDHLEFTASEQIDGVMSRLRVMADLPDAGRGEGQILIRCDGEDYRIWLTLDGATDEKAVMTFTRLAA